MQNIVLLLVICSISRVYALPQPEDSLQSTTATNLIYGEVATALIWGWGSVNYEKGLSDNLSIRTAIGAGYFNRIEGGSANGFGPTLMFNYFPVGVEHRMEIGVGASLTHISSVHERYKFEPFSDYIDTDRWLLFPAGSIAYRYQPRSGGLFFRIGVTFENYFGTPLAISLGHVW